MKYDGSLWLMMVDNMPENGYKLLTIMSTTGYLLILLLDVMIGNGSY